MSTPRRRARQPAASPRDILFSSVTAWGRSPYWRWRCLFREAVRAGHRVLWVDGLCAAEMLPDPLHRLPTGPPGLLEVEPGIHLLRGRLGPAPARPVRAAAARLDFNDVLLWAGTPWSAALVGEVGERLSVFDCADDFQLLFGPETFRQELEVLSRVDLVIACTPALAEARQPFTRQVIAIRNGVDHPHFATGGPIWAGLATLPRPIVVYWGAIYERIDWSLVVAVAESGPELTFVFAGEINQEPPAEVRRLPNVHFVGQRDYEDGPALYRAAGAAWLPHRFIELTARQSSLKLLEYLAAGLPTVTCGVEPEPAVEAVVRVARGPVETLAGLRAVIADDSPERRAEQRAAARLNSWQVRWEEIEAAIGATAS